MNYIEYNEELHGKLTYPENMESILKELSLEEQIDLFRIGNGVYLRQPVAERRYSYYMVGERIDKIGDVKSIIVNNGVIAGVMIQDCHGDVVPCLPEQGFVFSDESEQDGSGYKNRIMYLYLICVSKDFDKKD